MKNIYVVRPTGFNIGNHIIFAGIRKLFRENSEHSLNFITIPASRKYDNFGKPGLTASSIHEINQYGDYVVLGGGNLFENGELDVDSSSISALRVPLLILGVSWGRIYGRDGALTPRTDSISDDKLKSLISRAALVSVRENSTLEKVSSFRDDCQVDGCPSINISTEAFRKSKSSLGSSVVLIPIRHPNLMNIMPIHQNQVASDIYAIISHIERRNLKPILVCHDHRDISFASLFQGTPYIYEESVSSFLSLISNVKAIVSYRLHATIPSLVLETPTLNISYDERAQSLLTFHKAERLNVNMLGENVVSRVERFLDDVVEGWDFPKATKDSFIESKEMQKNLIRQFIN
jgi:exopolysaccharide biosynthesis predicted pyruvyltransferase EpsI